MTRSGTTMGEQVAALTEEGGDQTVQRRYLALGIFLVAIWWVSLVHAEPSIYPTGVTRYDPSKACNVFVLFSGSDDKTHLIDMEGNEVHRWDIGASRAACSTRHWSAAPVGTSWSSSPI
jgi:hypothetical protein